MAPVEEEKKEKRKKSIPIRPQSSCQSAKKNADLMDVMHYSDPIHPYNKSMMRYRKN